MPDLEQAIGFYHDVLGLPLSHEPSGLLEGPEVGPGVGVPGAALKMACLACGDALVELVEYAAPETPNDVPPPPNAIGAAHLAFRVQDIAAHKRALERKGVQFTSDINVEDEGSVAGWRWVYFRDPAGNTLELVEEAYTLPEERKAAIAEYGRARAQPRGPSTRPLLEVAINGARTDEEHPGIPRTPEQLARATRESVDAGAQAVHMHPYNAAGAETLAAEPCAAAIEAVRALCPGIPISLSTSEAIEPDPERRLALISAWTVLPDLVTANMGEPAINELCEHLIGRGVGIEAGLLSVADAQAFVESAVADRCVRVMIEPLDADPAAAVAHAEAMETIVSEAGIPLEQVHHGDGVASWAVSRRGVARGHGFRTGLEDTVLLPDGSLARDNAELVRLAAGMMR